MQPVQKRILNINIFLNSLKKNINLKTYDLVDNYEKLKASIFVDYPLVPSKKAIEIFNLDIPKILITDENKYLRPSVWSKDNLKFLIIFFVMMMIMLTTKNFLSITHMTILRI